MDDWREEGKAENGGWSEVGQGRPATAYAPEAPDNVDTVPGWLWFGVVGSVLACLGSVVLGVLGVILLAIPPVGVALLCLAGILGPIGLVVGIQAWPLAVLALNQARSRPGV